jgi:hypothetical protein
MGFNRKQNLRDVGGREAWIEMQRLKGEQKRAERGSARAEG